MKRAFGYVKRFEKKGVLQVIFEFCRAFSAITEEETRGEERRGKAGPFLGVETTGAGWLEGYRDRLLARMWM